VFKPGARYLFRADVATVQTNRVNVDVSVPRGKGFEFIYIECASCSEAEFVAAFIWAYACEHKSKTTLKLATESEHALYDRMMCNDISLDTVVTEMVHNGHDPASLDFSLWN